MTSTRSPRPKPSTKTRAADNARQLQRLRARLREHGTQAIYESGLLYDHLYQRRRADVRFYVEVAQRYGGPVLELGVGTGRVAFALAAAGIDVVGVDAMSSMLGHARARSQRLPQDVQDRIELRRGDMRALRLKRRFPLVIAPFNAFMHLYTRRDIERALAVCRAHLAPRGRLVFDVTLPNMRALAQDPDRLYKYRAMSDPRDGRRYVQYEASDYDATEQIRNMTLLFERTDDREARYALPLVHRQFFPAELEALLFYNGFAIEHLYGDFGGGPLSTTSDSQVIVARPRTVDARAPRSRA